MYVVFLYAFYFHSAVKLGFFPYYDNPDPKEIGLYEIYEPIINLFGNIWLILFCIWIPLILIYWIIYKKKTDWKPIIISAVSFLIAFLSFFTEVTEWFAD